MATHAQSPHARPAPELDNRRIGAAAIDLAAPALAGAGLLAAGLLTPFTALVLLAWTVYYFFALESGGGQTIGKRALTLRVVDAGGHEPTMRQAAIRNLVRVVDLPLVGLLVMIASGDSRQRLGDRAAETYVVDAEAPATDPLAVTQTLEALAPGHVPAEGPPKARRKTLGGPELKLPKFGRKPKPVQAKAVAPEPVAVVAEPEAKEPKGKRKTLGGPELKLPKFGRKPKPVAPEPVAVVAEPAAVEPKAKRKTLGGPELKLPKFGRKPKPVQAKAAEPKPRQPKAKRKTLGGPEIKLPKFGRKAKPAPVEPEVSVAPVPEPEPEPAPHSVFTPDREAEVTIEREPEVTFDREPEVTIDREPEVTVDREPEVTIDREPEPEPDISFTPDREPEVVIDRPEPEPEPRVSFPSEPEPEPEPEPEVEPELEDPVIEVKPIETVSAIDLVMQDADEQHRPGG